MKVIYYYFSFPTLCHLLSFLMEVIFFFPREAFLCAVCASCPQHRAAWPGRTQAQRGCRSGPGGPAAGGKPQEARVRGRRRQQAGPSTPARPLASDSLCTAHQRPGPLTLPSQQLFHLSTLIPSRRRLLRPWNRRLQTQGREIVHSGMAGAPRLPPTCLLRPK